MKEEVWVFPVFSSLTSRLWDEGFCGSQKALQYLLMVLWYLPGTGLQLDGDE